MKTKNQQFKGSPVAVAYYDRSVEFFRNHDVTTVGYNFIPDDLLEAWVAPDPHQLLSDMADGKAEPDSILPFAVFSNAYGYHDQIYAAILKDDSYSTPYEKIIEDFFLFQEALHYIVELQKRNYFFIPLPILHFNALPEMLPLLREAVQRLGVL
ncbi:hypothetical protein [Alistipes sp. cv1]|uniref:hypothetical protein n=1 Tax=Alistipes sp. cv1 TaxID=1622071 RepID=UPI000C758721|nr:hypothetical protein [Alistipes sp. cv1]